jgi:hypothetical protein
VHNGRSRQRQDQMRHVETGTSLWRSRAQIRSRISAPEPWRRAHLNACSPAALLRPLLPGLVTATHSDTASPASADQTLILAECSSRLSWPSGQVFWVMERIAGDGPGELFGGAGSLEPCAQVRILLGAPSYTRPDGR